MASAYVYLTRPDESSAPCTYDMHGAFDTQQNVFTAILKEGRVPVAFCPIPKGTKDDIQHFMMALIKKFDTKIVARNPIVQINNIKISEFYAAGCDIIKDAFAAWQNTPVPSDDEIHNRLPPPPPPEKEPATVVIEKESATVVIEKEPATVVIEKEPATVVIEKEISISTSTSTATPAETEQMETSITIPAKSLTNAKEITSSRAQEVFEFITNLRKNSNDTLEVASITIHTDGKITYDIVDLNK